MPRLRLLLPAIGLLLVGWFVYTSDTGGGARGTVERPETTGMMAPRAAQRVAPGTAMVRFVNALPHSAAMEFDEDSTSIVSNVIFGAVSPYMPRAHGARTFRLRHTGGVVDALLPANLLEGERYTVLGISDSAGRPTLAIVLDELHPDPGRARIRVINAAAARGELVVRLRGADDVFLSAIHGTAVAAVRDLVPTTAGFSIRDRGNQSLAVVPAQALSEGTAYTIVAAAKPDASVSPIFIVDYAGELRDRATLARE